jgi:AcrR family transcriptional regulator
VHTVAAVAAPERLSLRFAPLTDRSTAYEDRRRAILAAAVRVFARRGYHGARVGDIAEEAGVAHGLLYHYFSSKEEVLATVFRENWRGLLEALHRVEATPEPADAQLRGVVKILLRSWRNDPDLVRVMVREVARSPHLQAQVDEVREVFLVVQRIVEHGQGEGSFRSDLDARLASWVIYGGLEEILTGWALGQLADGGDSVGLAERTVVYLVLGGIGVGVAARA